MTPSVTISPLTRDPRSPGGAGRPDAAAATAKRLGRLCDVTGCADQWEAAVPRTVARPPVGRHGRTDAQQATGGSLPTKVTNVEMGRRP